MEKFNCITLFANKHKPRNKLVNKMAGPAIGNISKNVTFQLAFY